MAKSAWLHQHTVPVRSPILLYFSRVVIIVTVLQSKAEGWQDIIFMDDSQGKYYYINRFTGHSTWAKPVGWDDILSANGGWMLCLDVASGSYYWWNEMTGASSWVD